MACSEERWIRGAREYDHEILAEIYDTLSPELYRYAYRLLGQRWLAEDVLGETFLRFLRTLQAGGGPDRHLKAYLYRITHNLAMDRYRRKSNQEQALDRDTDTPAEEIDLLEQAHHALSQEQAREVLWHLTSSQRQVILLRYFQGLSHEEIASVIHKPVGAVKALQHRGVRALRRILQREYGWEWEQSG